MNKKEKLLLYMGDRGVYLLVFNLFCLLIFTIYLTHSKELNMYNVLIIIFVYFSLFTIFIRNRIKKHHLKMKEITYYKLKYLKFVSCEKPHYFEEVFKNKKSLVTLSDLEMGDNYSLNIRYESFDSLHDNHYFLFVRSLHDENVLELMRPHWLPLYNETEKKQLMNALDKSKNARLHYVAQARKILIA